MIERSRHSRGTPHSNSVYHISTAEIANDMPNNGNCSPKVQSGEKKTVCNAIVKEEEKIETGVCQGQKVVNSDVQSTRESFEDALSSLMRTKESIGFTTRLAVDLMKFGSATKFILMAALSSLFCLCLGVSSAPTHAFSPYSSAYSPDLIQSLDTLSSHSGNIHLVKFLLRIIPLLHQDLVLSYGFLRSGKEAAPT